MYWYCYIIAGILGGIICFLLHGDMSIREWLCREKNRIKRKLEK